MLAAKQPCADSTLTASWQYPDCESTVSFRSEEMKAQPANIFFLWVNSISLFCYEFIYQRVCPSVCRSAFLPACRSASQPVCPSTCLSFWFSVFLSDFLFVCLSVFLYFCLSFCLSLCLSFRLSRTFIYFFFIFSKNYFFKALNVPGIMRTVKDLWEMTAKTNIHGRQTASKKVSGLNDHDVIGWHRLRQDRQTERKTEK